MKIVWSAEIDRVLSRGRPLFPEHSNWALNRPAALTALAELKKLGVGVLGGDVLVLETNRFEHAYANWHCEPAKGEKHLAFVNRSIDTATNYITGYPEDRTAPFFAIVPLSIPLG